MIMAKATISYLKAKREPYAMYILNEMCERVSVCVCELGMN